MKIGLVYSSISGNTKKIADELINEFNEIEYYTSIDKLDIEKIMKYDILIICHWCFRGNADLKTIKLIESLKDKKLITIGTLGAYPDSDHGLRMQSRIKEIAEKNNNTIIGKFYCQGRIDPAKTEKRRNLPKDAPHYLDEAGYARHLESRKHPNSEDFNNAIIVVRSSLLTNSKKRNIR